MTNGERGKELPKGWVRDENGALRRATIPSMLRRLVGWNYCGRAIYQITITLEDRASAALGRVEVKVADAWRPVDAAKGAGLSPDRVEARFVASALGEAILGHWLKIPAFTPEIKPMYCQLMPDHLHAILEVTRPMARPLGNAIGGFKTGCEKIYQRLAPLKRGEGRLFAKGFQDTVLLRAGQLHNMFNYLADNPRRLAIKRLFPALFKTVSELKIPLRLAPQGHNEPRVGACAVPKAQAFGYFSALGNRFLLERPMAQIQVSRRLFGYKRTAKTGGGQKIARDATGEPLVAFSSPDYEAHKASLFAAAKHGTTLISPCVSDGERQIAREALAAGLPLITLHNKGFSPLQKPNGRYFDACANGRLLMLAPAAWPYQPGAKAMTRDEATAMNRLCQGIAGEGAAEINYHGREPANIDALACAAARVVFTPVHGAD